MLIRACYVKACDVLHLFYSSYFCEDMHTWMDLLASFSEDPCTIQFI